MEAVLLHLAGGHPEDAELAEEEDQVQAAVDVVAVNPALATLAAIMMPYF
ncbi:MAG TPA: hypothetical protein VHW66_22085 [Stellaceae bacterium]|nr:hypothetical protein [Stellaceae bacterium]